MNIQNTGVIEVEGLTKRFGRLPAVEDLDLNIRRSEIYGFLGLNGAGKTTTIRMLLGLIKASSGKVRIQGQPVRQGRCDVWSRVGYMVEAPHPYADLTVRENLEIVRRWRRIQDRRVVDEIMELLGLRANADRKARVLSLGNVQRLGLAKALMHHPDILILDEPANSLDPAGIVEIRRLLADLAQNQGVTVFISSHILSEVSKLATRIGIIHRGRLIKELDTRGLNALRQPRLTVTSRDFATARSVLERAGWRPENSRQAELRLADPAAVEHPETIAQILVQAGCPLTRLAVEQDDLEAWFLNLITTEEEKRCISQ